VISYLRYLHSYMLFAMGMSRPALRPERAGIVHLGLGRFHRAHQAVYTADAIDAKPGDWGIVAFAHSSRRVVDILRAQDLRYTVLKLDSSGPRADLIGVHHRVAVAADSPAELACWLADPGIRVVTLTVTEAGYTASPRTRRLDTTDPRVITDLRDRTTHTMVGCLVAGLRARCQQNQAPLSVLSCDNISGNGAFTHDLVREFLSLSTATDRDEVLAWLDASVAFPDSMVDRMVPETTPRHLDLVHAARGVRDEAAVVAEPYSSWVIENRFAAGRPAWDRVGVTFTSQVSRYEQLKLRCVNAAHSLIAYLGLLAGLETIADAVAREWIEAAARAFLEREMAPSLIVPDGVDITQYLDDVIERFRNPRLRYACAQVASDGSLKLPNRVGRALDCTLAAGRDCTLTALLFAAYLAVMTGVGPGGRGGSATVSDPLRLRLLQLLAGAPSPREFVEAVADSCGLFATGATNASAFLGTVTDLYGRITGFGVERVSQDVISARPN
jgi:fructuronate reductase